MLTADDPYFGIDLDNCIDLEQGVWTSAQASNIYGRFNTYNELSISKTGLHIIGKGKLPSGGCRKGNVEIYDSSRYLVFTGFTDAPSEINACQAELEALHQEIFGESTPLAHSESAATVTQQTGNFPVPDDILLEKARTAVNGEKFWQLWEGQWQATSYSSQSEADMALCAMLAFWTGGRADWTDDLFR